MKNILTVVIALFFAVSLLAQDAPKSKDESKAGEKAKTETAKQDCNKEKKACCPKAKAECKDAKESKPAEKKK